MTVILRIFKMLLKTYKMRLIGGYISVVGAALSALAIPKVLGASVNSALTTFVMLISTGFSTLASAFTISR